MARRAVRPATLRGSLTTGLGVRGARRRRSATSEMRWETQPSRVSPAEPRRHAAAMMVAVTDAQTREIGYAIGARSQTRAPGADSISPAPSGHEATIYVPSLVLVEIAEAFHRGALSSDGGYSAWSRRLLNAGRFPVADLTGDIVLAAESRQAVPERGDRRHCRDSGAPRVSTHHERRGIHPRGRPRAVIWS